MKDRVAIIAGHAPSLLNFRGDLIRALLGRNVDVVTIAPFDEYREVATELQKLGVHTSNVALDRTGTGAFSDVRTAWNYFWALRRTRPNIVLAYTIKPIVYGLIAAKLAGVRTRVGLVTGLGFAFSPRVLDAPTLSRAGVFGTVVRALYRISCRSATTILFQNCDDQVLFDSLGICKLSRSRVIAGSGVNLDRFRYSPRSENFASTSSGKPAEVVFLMIARLLVDKGVREYVAAAEFVAQSHPGRARFQLIGPFEENANAISEKEFLELKHGDSVVEYLGPVKDVREPIAACDVYVLPSYREGTPRTVLEAMAIGRPVVTTDVPGCRDATQDAETGVLVPSGDARALAHACVRLINDPAARSRMGVAGRLRAEAVYDVRLVNAQICSALGV